ncbi:MAG: peptidylprolyl isomerase [Saprospiraceae bacterium]|nr:peptidylprolyl isomerase [Saprospiraceae bacterium]
MRLFIFITTLAVILTSCAKPIADFSIQSEKKKVTVPQQFENKSKKATAYEWDFGDGNKSTEPSPRHTYYHSGHYNVTLKAMDGKRKTIKNMDIVIEPSTHCLVLIETEFGNMLVELSDATPLHRDNFLKLVEQGYYDGLAFHRVINHFMIQGGDPNSKGDNTQGLGSGGPGYTIPAEFVDTLYHLKGAIAAARMGGPSNPEKRSSGSQFYIVQGQPVDPAYLDAKEASSNIKYPTSIKEAYETIGGTPHLDGEYTVFGKVIEGLDVIDKIAAQQTGPGDRPVKPIRMKIITIK